MNRVKIHAGTAMAAVAATTICLAGASSASADVGAHGQVTGAVTLPPPGGDGGGWTAALRQTSTGQSTLTVVSPSGGVRGIGKVPSTPSPQQIVHVDADAGRVVTDDHWRDDDADPMDDGPLRVQVWNTHTKAKRQLKLPYTYDAAYTDRAILLGIALSAHRCVIDTYNYNGVLQHRTTSFPCDQRATPSVSADGVLVAVNAPDAVRVWNTRSGKQVNTFAPPRPTVQDESWCSIDGYFDRSTSLFTCVVVGDKNYQYAVNLRTGEQRSIPYGASATVSVPDGVVTHDIVPEHNPWTLHPRSGDAVRLDAPEYSRLTGSDRSVLYLQDVNSPGSIMTYNARTGRLVHLTDTDDGQFSDALTVDRMQQAAH